jgi:hypothetical protein
MDTIPIIGVSPLTLFMVMFFWAIVALAIFGPGAWDDRLTEVTIVFLTFGTSVLIGQFGWGILVLPSLVVILGAAYLVWKLFSN